MIGLIDPTKYTTIAGYDTDAGPVGEPLGVEVVVGCDDTLMAALARIDQMPKTGQPANVIGVRVVFPVRTSERTAA